MLHAEWIEELEAELESTDNMSAPEEVDALDRLPRCLGGA